MNETAKATRRRFIEHNTGVFPWLDIFRGHKGLDVGCGDDPLPFDDCRGFDRKDGDANVLSNYFAQYTFDYLHASQCLEHMHDPVAALREWIKVVKHEGHIIVTVPDVVLYEGFAWPSRFNPDHKSTWSLCYRRSLCPLHIYVPDFLKGFEDVAECRLVRLLDTNYDFRVMTTRDQSYHESDGVECWIEFVLQKK